MNIWKILAITSYAVAYGWIWLASWWGHHLATEGWIELAQVASILIFSVGVYALCAVLTWRAWG